MKRGLFLDDERMPHDVTWIDYPFIDIKWTIYRTAEEFVMDFSEFDEVGELVLSFDHDLGKMDDGTERKNGYWALRVVLDELIARNILAGHSIPYIRIHSKNPVGLGNMVSLFNSFIKTYNI